MAPRELADATERQSTEAQDKNAPQRSKEHQTNDAAAEDRHETTSTEEKRLGESYLPAIGSVLPAQEDTDESGHGTFRNVLGTLMYPNRNFETQWEQKAELGKEREAGRITQRLHQALLHKNLTHLRIEELEAEVRKLKVTVTGKEDEDWASARASSLPTFRQSIERIQMKNFPLSMETIHLPTKKQSTLQVAYGYEVPELTQWLSASSMGRPGDADSPVALPGAPPVRLPIPERLRIRSRLLLKHLDGFSSTSLMLLPSETTSDWGKQVFPPMVFLRPFEFFLEQEKAIRGSKEDVKERIAQRTALRDDGGPKARRQHVEEIENDKSLLIDLDHLIQFLDHDLRTATCLRDQIEAGTLEDIEYADLCHLFRRGTMIISQTGPAHAYQVINWAGGRDALNGLLDQFERDKIKPINGFAIDCFYIKTDGASSYVPCLETFKITRYHGKRAIRTLPVYPLHFKPEAEDLKVKFMKQGQNVVDVTRERFRHKRFRGRTLDEPPMLLDNHVIVDTDLALTAQPELRSKSKIEQDDLTKGDIREVREKGACKHGLLGCCGSDYIFDDVKLGSLNTEAYLHDIGHNLGPMTASDIQDDLLMLVRTHVHVFVLRSRSWHLVNASDLQDVDFENNFDDLVIAPEHKRTVQALVQTHENANKNHALQPESSSGATLDLVKGKGSGLIILLHGPPGVGKTSTAECVADNTGRPLFPITCGDLGDTAAEVEKALQWNFQLAHKWGCVLLLDEADVFLARRTRTNLRHNAVTSVFLRCLEYYAGILFLTTNREGTIDPAFRSRIQMTVRYHHFTSKVNTKMFKMFVRRTKEQQKSRGAASVQVNEEEIMEFGKSHYKRLKRERRVPWNGRQIRNAFQTAIALAEFQKIENGVAAVVGKAQFETVAKGYEDFEDYIDSTTGVTEQDQAKQEGLRDDTFDVNPPEGRSLFHSKLSPSTTRAPVYSARSLPQGYPDQSETSSDSSDDDDDDDDSSKGSGKTKGKRASMKEASPSSGMHAKESSGAGDAMEEEFRQYQAFMAMKKAQSK